MHLPVCHATHRQPTLYHLGLYILLLGRRCHYQLCLESQIILKHALTGVGLTESDTEVRQFANTAALVVATVEPRQATAGETGI